MEVVVLSPKDMATFKAKTRAVYDKWIKEIGADLVSAAEKMVKAVTP
jgi:TRAP-type C4-dicarboxylate transport system substrate-binding protein